MSQARPDYPATALTPEAFAGVLQRQGVLLLREVLPAKAVTAWLPIFLSGGEGFDALYASGGMDQESYLGLYRFGHISPDYIANFGAWIELVTRAPALVPILKAYFGPDAYLMKNHCAPRRQRASQLEHAISFHQDQEFMGRMQRALNLWTPLTPAGGDWPGLELWVDGPRGPLLSFSMPPAERETLCAAIPPDALWRPRLSPGDMLLFDPYLVHRTWLGPEMRQERISSELRLLSPDDAATVRSALIPIRF